jgi:hypothetical protein
MCDTSHLTVALDQPGSAEERIMKLSIFFSIALLLNPMLVCAQNASKGEKPNGLHHERISITGCLTKNSLNEFELVDRGGIDNLPYSAVVDLDQYVGKTVTLFGRRAATPHDTGREKPHFQVSKVQSVSDQCKK